MKQAQVTLWPPVSINSGGDPVLTTAGTPDVVNSWTATVSGAPSGNGVYKFTASSNYFDKGQLVGGQWGLFSRPTVHGGVWAHPPYVNGLWPAAMNTPRYTLDSSYYGEWMTIQMPTPIYLARCTFKARPGFSNRMPGRFKIYG